ncbi:uncharacterized protein ASCRUDRAFT_81018 [Ascoidea rubescens DSM 1968]|uniref:FHA domain-containing protein n=1 Tax=Ascoidea rubescens DSM 1968 TaxID=1344418 RepID=A0A1D2VIH9_9ASCO|nr:hypothetical protein ASCRUDRAFT_81018 [Ascoidea rubescens DSM 1968]ODV61303.1 hypothetical protein ASCRUDRAFT_81018 [Ascoidea rubescens DSM 1968]
MWLIRLPDENSGVEYVTRWLMPNKPYSIGRDRTSDVYLSQKYISKHHFTIKVDNSFNHKNPEVIPDLHLVLYGKAATFVSKKQIFSNGSQDSPSSLIYNGRNLAKDNTIPITIHHKKTNSNFTFEIVWNPILISYSADDNSEKLNLDESLENTNIHYTTQFLSSTTYTLKSLKYSSKLIISLINQTPIVNFDFITSIKNAISTKISDVPDLQNKLFNDKKNFKVFNYCMNPYNLNLLEFDYNEFFPNYKKFLDDPLYGVDQARKVLFKNTVFIFNNLNHFDYLKVPIQLASGNCLYFDLSPHLSSSKNDTKSIFNLFTNAVDECISGSENIDKDEKVNLILLKVPKNSNHSISINDIENNSSKIGFNLIPQLQLEIARYLNISVVENLDLLNSIKNVDLSILLNLKPSKPSDIDLEFRSISENNSADITNGLKIDRKISSPTIEEVYPKNRLKRRKLTRNRTIKRQNVMDVFNSMSRPSFLEDVPETGTDNFSLVNMNDEENNVQMEVIDEEIKSENISENNKNVIEDIKSIGTRKLKRRANKVKRLSNPLIKNAPSPTQQIVISDNESAIEDSPIKKKKMSREDKIDYSDRSLNITKSEKQQTPAIIKEQDQGDNNQERVGNKRKMSEKAQAKNNEDFPKAKKTKIDDDDDDDDKGFVQFKEKKKAVNIKEIIKDAKNKEQKRIEANQDRINKVIDSKIIEERSLK